MTEIFGTVAMLLAVVGVLLNNRRIKLCFVLWLVSNAITAVLHVKAGIFSLAIRDALFFVLAIEGYFKWKK